jgi:hypothetical protein
MLCLRRSKASDYPFDIFKLIDNSILNQKKPDLVSNGNIHNRLVYFHLSNIWGFLLSNSTVSNSKQYRFIHFVAFHQLKGQS